MSTPGIWLLLPLGVLAALWIGLKVLIFFTALIETLPVHPYVPAPRDDPGWSNIPGEAGRAQPAPSDSNPYAAPGHVEYAATVNQAAAELGFSFHGLHRYVKQGGIYQTRTALWVSPSRTILALVRWGTTAAIDNSKTILYTALDDGTFLVTADKPTGNETPGLYDYLIVMKADFPSLVRRHERRLLESGRRAVPFTSASALADYESRISERRARHLFEKGDAYYIDPAGTAVRLTLKGALKMVARSFRPHKKVEMPAGGPASATGAKKPPAALVGAEWFCTFTLFYALVFQTAAGPRTTAQQLFRLGMIASSTLGLVVIYIIKGVRKWRSA